MALDDVVVLNVDTNTLESPYDDLQSLPNDVVRTSYGFTLRIAALKSQTIHRNDHQVFPRRFPL